MNEKQLLKIFEATGALLRGHFELSSGLHSDQYFQCALVLQYPRYAEKFGKRIGAQFKGLRVNCVVGPALGGITMAYEVARALKARALFAERLNDQMELRRGFAVSSRDRVLVVEDVITTGGSVLEVADLVRKKGAQVVGIGSIVDRSSWKVRFEVPHRSLIQLEARSFQPSRCPLCKKGVPFDKPGSRPIVHLSS